MRLFHVLPYIRLKGVFQTLLQRNFVFQGEVEEGAIGRRGIFRWLDGSMYEGSLYSGMRNGYGRFMDASTHSFYSGNWLCGHSQGYVSPLLCRVRVHEMLFGAR